MWPTPTRNRGAGVANGTRYRYIGDETLENAGSAGAASAQASSSAGAAAKTRSRPNSEYVLYAQGEPVAVNSDNGVSYFGTDILGSVRSVTDRNGQVKASYEYDAFGSPYLANLENDVGFGYCGKVYDSDTGLYDYGFRDYSPNSARFTTVDPVRDGSNWFSYVVNDPVNYIDPFGLTPSDAGNTSKIASRWSDIKATVKGWGESIKSDITQTWNDIKQVVSNAITETVSVAKTVVSNIQTSVTKWISEGKAEVKATENQIKKVVKNSFIGEAVKEKISKVATYQMINETGDPFFPFPESDTKNMKNSDGGINLITKQGYKISDGWSVTITTTGEIDENGNTVYHYEPKNEVPKNHPILRWIVDKTFELKEFNGIEDWNNSQEGYWLDLPSYKEALEIFNQQGELK